MLGFLGWVIGGRGGKVIKKDGGGGIDKRFFMFIIY